MWYFRSKNGFTLSGKQPSNPDNIVNGLPSLTWIGLQKTGQTGLVPFSSCVSHFTQRTYRSNRARNEIFLSFLYAKKIEISFTVLHQSCTWNLRFHWLFSTNNDLWLYPLQDWWKTVNEISNFMYTGEIGNFIFHLVSGKNRYQKFWEGRSYSYTS